VAKKLCSGIVSEARRENCELDVMATGEAGFANTYLATEQIERNGLPTAPKLTFPEDNKVGLGRSVSFGWSKAGDPEGDKLAYMHCLWAAGEKPTFARCVASATFSRTVSELKPRTAYFWKVIVEDGRGGTVESETRRLATK
jgi:hypothetical protein